MSRLSTIGLDRWTEAIPPAVASQAIVELERGQVLFFPRLSFAIAPDAGIFSPSILSASKNASFDPASGRIGGTTLTGVALEPLRQVFTDFSAAATDLVVRLFPPYREQLTAGRASFRPAEIAGRQSSWRKDDTRLHVDGFPASPVQGRRILRLFSNVNPSGQPRVWRIGDDFTEVAERFVKTLRAPLPGTASVLRLLRLTKSRRTAYDALMLQLHDRMKQDATFQAQCSQEQFAFPAGSSWVAFTDQVSHAAMAGQYQLEQTFLLPVEAMQQRNQSPLAVLERLTGRRLR